MPPMRLLRFAAAWSRWVRSPTSTIGVMSTTSTLVIFGGASEIGGEVARRLAAGRRVVLAARDVNKLTEPTATMRTAGAVEVVQVPFDAADITAATGLVDELVADYGAIDIAVVAFGVLGDQARAEADGAYAADIVHVDYTAQVALLTALASQMKRQGGGQIVAFSSIAGHRVRRANYVYGSAKAGLDGFIQGLQDALAGTGVQLLLARPGFVIGRMTEGMKPAPLSSTPQQVAEAVVEALAKGKTRIWVPGALALLAAAMSVTPRAIWRRMPR